MRCVALLGLVLWGCVDVDVHGGAIELAWKLYRRDGIACCPDEDPCRKSRTEQVLVQLTPLGAGQAVERAFACNASQGSTRFDLPPGHYAIQVIGQCAGGRSATGPGPIERDIRNGEVAQLGAVALTVDSVDRCCAPDGTAGCS